MSYNMSSSYIPGGNDDFWMPVPVTAPEVVSPAPQRIMPEVPEQMQNEIAAMELEAKNPTSKPTQIQQPPATSQPPSQGGYHQRTGSAPNVYNQAAVAHLPVAYAYDDEQSKPSQTPASNPYGQRPGQNSYNQGYGNTTHNNYQDQNAAGQGAFPQRHSSIATAYQDQPPTQQQTSQGSHDYLKIVKVPDIPNFSPFPKLVNPPKNVPPSDEEKEAILENARVPVLNSNDPEMQLAWAHDALIYVEAAQSYEIRISEGQPARPSTPQVEHQLRVDAMNIVTFLADQHHPKAEFLRGMWLEFAKFGYRVDKKEAFRCYSRASEKGYARADYRMGMQFEQANEPIKALTYYKRGADSGDSASNYRLGMMTLLGQNGQPQDYAKGVQLLRQSANNADENAPQGAYVLGMLQVRELPQVNVPEIYLPFDERIARQNIEKAAYLGFAKAQLKMGSAYEVCSLGCEFNPALSLHYNALAARQGEAEAELAISKWFLCGYEDVFKKNEELAYTYAQRAAAAHLDTAEFAMGYYNEVGMSVAVNLDKASEWYEKAAKDGNKDAVGRLEELSKKRSLSKKDHENLAIQRIRSQYGSMRGQRPDRMKPQKPTLPSISDDSGSEYSQSPASGHPGFGPSPVTSKPLASPINSSLPNRNATSTPYPLDDRPPQIDAPVRPATVTPYPLHDNPLPPRSGTARPAPAGNYYAPDRLGAARIPRPQSEAFTINPNLFAPQSQPPQGSGTLPYRPTSNVHEYGGGRGRPPPGPRYESDPAAARRQPADHMRRPSGPSSEVPAKAPAEKRPEPPKIDIGFSAPQDDRENKQSKPGQGGPGTPVDQVGYVAPLKTKPKDSTTLPSQRGRQNQTSQPPNRPVSQSPPRKPSGEPTRWGSPSRIQGDSRPGMRPNSRDRPQKIEQPPAQPAKTSGPPPPAKNETKPPAAPTPPPSAPGGKKPGKGPQTFEAMGIPVAAKKDNCAVM